TQEKGIPQINGSIGGSATVTFDPWTAGPGGYTAQICADIYDVVMEINETNNCTVLNQFLVSLEQPVITNIAATCTYATISWLPVSGARSYSLLVTGGEEHPSYYMSFSGWQNTSAFIITL